MKKNRMGLALLGVGLFGTLIFSSSRLCLCDSAPCLAHPGLTGSRMKNFALDDPHRRSLTDLNHLDDETGTLS